MLSPYVVSLDVHNRCVIKIIYLLRDEAPRGNAAPVRARRATFVSGRYLDGLALSYARPLRRDSPSLFWDGNTR